MRDGRKGILVPLLTENGASTVFLGRSFRDPRYGYSRKAAIESARAIILQLVKGSHLPYQHIWTVSWPVSFSPTHSKLTLTLLRCAGPLSHHRRFYYPHPRHLPVLPL